VSRSPARAVAGDDAEDYYRAFDDTYRLHALGRPFSGHERHCAYLNLGTGGGELAFADVSATSGLDFDDDGRAVAAADWDFDGDLDLWMANRTAPKLRYLQNDLPSGDRFVAVLLEGRQANRDAVGARAELWLRDAGGDPAAPPVKLIRTRYAGQGFLGQSSSWLHFGLDPSAGIERLVVRWPGGASSEHTDIEPGRHYRIVEGEDAVPWTPPAAGALPAPAPPPEDLLAADRATLARALLVGRPPMPQLRYRDPAGAETELARVGDGGATLLNFWASWCLPCVAELEDLTAHAAALRDAGLEVVALSVDGLDPAKGTGPADAEAMMARLGLPAPGFPFRWGLADASILDRTQLLLDVLFSRQILLAVPTSLLIDGDGRLAAVYRGPVDLERLLDDTRNLGAGLDERRAMATPFSGRWLAPPQVLAPTTIARRFAEEGFLDDAGGYLREALEVQGESAGVHVALADLRVRQQDPADAESHYRRALELAPDDAGAHRKLADLLAGEGTADEALEHYARALEIEPGASDTRFNYGNALQAAGRLDEAAGQYRQALAIDGDLADAHNNLAALLLQRGDADEAVVHLRETLRLDPDLASAHNNLGILLLRRGETAAAIEHLSRAVELDPQDAGARANLAVAREALSGSR
jgi:Tfp pilus assembly protein PilF/thiol-disulfide isomerase/thioredoxin